MSIYKNHKKLFDCTIKSQNNEGITLSEIIAKIDEMSNAYQISKLQWPTYDKIFSHFKIAEFKNQCEKTLKNVEITLINRPQLIKSIDERQQILKKFHDDEIYGGHCGQKRLYAKIRSAHYWPKMANDVAKYVKNCHICKMTKPNEKTKMPLKLTETPPKPFDIIQIDTIGPMQKSNNGYQYAITLMDELTKYLVIIPITDKSAKTTARSIFEHFILIYGPMKSIKTDLGTEYINSVLTELCKLLKIDHLKSTAYHHQTMGTIERSHRLLNEYLRAYLNGNLTEWDTYAQYFSFCYNTTPSAAINFKYSPFELVFMRKSNIPNEILSGKLDPVYNVDNVINELKYRLQRASLETKSIIDKIKKRNKLNYDKSINPLSFENGEMIKIKNEPYDKFRYIYSGPYVILHQDEENVWINLNGNEYKINKNRIVKYK